MEKLPVKAINCDIQLIKKRRTRATIGFIVIMIIENIVNQATMIILAETLPSYNWLVLVISDTTSYTLAAVFYNFGKLLLIVPLSRLSDKIGRKKVLLVSFSFSISSLIIIYFATSTEVVYIGRLLFGMNSFVGVVTALIDDYYSEESRGQPLGYMSAAMLVGFLGGSILGPIIFLSFGNKNSFIFLDGVMLLSFINVILSIDDHPNWLSKKKKHLTDSEKRILKQLARDPRFIGSVIINFFANMTFLGSGIYWNYIILSHFNVPNNIAGLWFLPPLIADFLTYLFVPLVFRKRLHNVILYACIGGIPASIILFFEPNLILFTISGIIFGILNSSVIQANDTISLNFIPKEIKGTAIGILKFFTIGAATAGPLLFGLIGDFLGVFIPLFAFPVMLVIVGATYWLLVYQKIKKNNEVH